MIPGVIAVGVVAALTARLAWSAESAEQWPVLALGLGGAVAVGVSLAWPPGLTAALVLPGSAYALLLAVESPQLGFDAALVATALLITAGLVDWSLELRLTSRAEQGGTWRRLAWLALGGASTFALVTALLALVDVTRRSGILFETLGAVAACAVLAVLAVIAMRPPTRG